MQKYINPISETDFITQNPGFNSGSFDSDNINQALNSAYLTLLSFTYSKIRDVIDYNYYLPIGATEYILNPDRATNDTNYRTDDECLNIELAICETTKLWLNLGNDNSEGGNESGSVYGNSYSKSKPDHINLTPFIIDLLSKARLSFGSKAINNSSCGCEYKSNQAIQNLNESEKAPISRAEVDNAYIHKTITGNSNMIVFRDSLGTEADKPYIDVKNEIVDYATITEINKTASRIHDYFVAIGWQITLFDILQSIECKLMSFNVVLTGDQTSIFSLIYTINGTPTLQEGTYDSTNNITTYTNSAPLSGLSRIDIIDYATIVPTAPYKIYKSAVPLTTEIEGVVKDVEDTNGNTFKQGDIAVLPNAYEGATIPNPLYLGTFNGSANFPTNANINDFIGDSSNNNAVYVFKDPAEVSFTLQSQINSTYENRTLIHSIDLGAMLSALNTWWATFHSTTTIMITGNLSLGYSDGSNSNYYRIDFVVSYSPTSPTASLFSIRLNRYKDGETRQTYDLLKSVPANTLFNDYFGDSFISTTGDVVWNKSTKILEFTGAGMITPDTYPKYSGTLGKINWDGSTVATIVDTNLIIKYDATPDWELDSTGVLGTDPYVTQETIPQVHGLSNVTKEYTDRELILKENEINSTNPLYNKIYNGTQTLQQALATLGQGIVTSYFYSFATDTTQLPTTGVNNGETAIDTASITATGAVDTYTYNSGWVKDSTQYQTLINTAIYISKKMYDLINTSDLAQNIGGVILVGENFHLVKAPNLNPLEIVSSSLSFVNGNLINVLTRANGSTVTSNSLSLTTANLSSNTTYNYNNLTNKKHLYEIKIGYSKDDHPIVFYTTTNQPLEAEINDRIAGLSGVGYYEAMNQETFKIYNSVSNVVYTATTGQAGTCTASMTWYQDGWTENHTETNNIYITQIF